MPPRRNAQTHRDAALRYLNQRNAGSVGLFYILQPGAAQFRALNGRSGQLEFIIGSRFGHTPSFASLSRDIRRLFTDIINFTRHTVPITVRDRTQVVIRDVNGFVISTEFRRGLTGTDVLNKVENALTSQEAFNIIGARVWVKYFIAPGGGAYVTNTLTSEQFLKRKKSIVMVQSDVNECFEQCIVLGIAHYESSDIYRKLTSGKGCKRYRALLAHHLR